MKLKFIRELYQYTDLLKILVARDVKLKYRRSVLGYVWSVLNPLMIMAVMTTVFSHMFRSNISNFPVYLFTAQLIFNFYSGSTNAAAFSIINNGGLLKKTYVPKYIFVLASVSSTFVDLLFNLGALIIVMVATHSPFSIYNLFFIIPIIEVYIFSVGVGLFISAANCFFRDIHYIYTVFVVALSYFTPIFYPVEMLPEKVFRIIRRFNPLYYYVSQFRDCIYMNCIPPLYMIVRGGIIAVIMLIIGILFFEKNQEKFILYI